MRGGIHKRVGKRGVTWQVRVEYPPDAATGRRVQRAESCPSREAAEARLAEWLTELHRGTALDPGATTVAEFLEHWLATHVQPNQRATTYRSYAGNVRHHLIPTLGRHRLAKLRPIHVQAAMATIRESARADGRAGQIAASTLHLIHRHLHLALTAAVAWGLITTNPATAARPGRGRPSGDTSFHVWDAGQLRAFLAAASEHTPAAWGPLWLLAVATGMRQAELIGLGWTQVDLDRGRLHVTRILTSSSRAARPVFAEPKTAAGRRVIPLDRACIAALRRHQTAQKELRLRAGSVWRRHDLVFTTAIGGPVLPAAVRERFHAIAAAADLPPVRFHDLRHSHATLLLREGVPVKIVSERLGHASVVITLDTYSHVLPDMQQIAVDALEIGLYGGVREQMVNE